MPRLLLVLLAAGLAIAATKPKQKAVKDELRKLQGTWKVIAAEADGKPVPAEKLKKEAGQMVIRESLMNTTPGGGKEGQLPFTIDPTKVPKAIDVTAGRQGTPRLTLKGIYKLEGNKLTICLGVNGRPAEFKTKAGAEQSLMVYQRSKEKATRK
jgi:uncharacterized protein (TIGR03067 family)